MNPKLKRSPKDKFNNTMMSTILSMMSTAAKKKRVVTSLEVVEMGSKDLVANKKMGVFKRTKTMVTFQMNLSSSTELGSSAWTRNRPRTLKTAINSTNSPTQIKRLTYRRGTTSIRSSSASKRTINGT